MSLKKKLDAWAKLYVAIPATVLLVCINLCLYLLLAPRVGTGPGVGILVGGVVISAALVYLLLRQARASATSSFLGTVGEVLTAGDWVFKHAEGNSPLENLQADESLIVKAGGRSPPQVVANLEEWLLNVQGEEEEAASGEGEVRRDLELAREFQQAYLNRPYPKIPQVHVEGRLRLEFHHYYEPALALGGDFYDIIPLASDCAGVFIADVMGHGTRSALITSILRTLIGDLHQQARNAPYFLTELNKQFCDMLTMVPNPLFASGYYFVPDTTARVATYSSAGHPAPFLVRSYLNRISRLEVPPPRGSALGLIPDETFTGGHVRLHPGDVFIFFTDGVYEAPNMQGEEFGVSRMEAVLKKNVYKSGHEMVDELMLALKGFVGDRPVNDDICLVAVEVTEKAASGETYT